MIELEGLTKRYGGKLAVDHLSFTVRPGVVTGFLGPNGAGKSTTMRMMLGLDRPTAGRVRIDGRRYEELADPLKYIGALLDAKATHGGRSAYNHLLCLAQSNGIPASRVHEVLDTVGLTSVARKKAKGFSLGMGQRLGIAAALLGDPRILMFDEPVNGLDPEGIHWIRTLMKSLAAQGRTVFVSSHLMSEMALTADHLVVIGQGRLLADTTMADFIARNSRAFVRVRSPQRERLLDALHDAGITVIEAGGGALEIDGDMAERIGELAARHGLVLHELSPQQASLEEAFMQLTAESVEYHAHSGPAPDRDWGENRETWKKVG
ncbi:ABC-2 type transport system ATP-binding protein [Streptomyces sp. B3I7]|uniref:ABC transporter ATP-binding protein n=1 Tax=Streptomyces sp. B3I7 TaxID=3042269 RepID=UPI00278B8D6A|nr:ABC transporter ATP-binding protein [Streptomyces sp. B3I7]MDQ0811134.1 ABC-2 type transport system ATP-binding protein [Streptomyces sp. B3I7]